MKGAGGTWNSTQIHSKWTMKWALNTTCPFPFPHGIDWTPSTQVLPNGFTKINIETVSVVCTRFLMLLCHWMILLMLTNAETFKVLNVYS